MEFRKVKSEETEAVLRLYRSVVGSPFCVWDENYPRQQEIDADFHAGNLYILTEDRQILGAISIVPVNELDSLPFWQIGDAAEIARVVTSPRARGQHLAQRMVTEIIHILRQQGCPAIHLIAASDNPPAVKTYKNCGFFHRGECDMYGHHYLAFELPL